MDLFLNDNLKNLRLFLLEKFFHEFNESTTPVGR
jgi:hypothetical protein